MTALAARCSDSTRPSPSPGFSIVSGADQSDTALARLPRSLVVLVRDADGRPAAGEVVRFESVPSDSPPHYSSVLVARATSSWYRDLAVDSTDAHGEAVALLQLGPLAGTGRVALYAPRLGYRDTVAFVVLPGAPTQLILSPADSAVYPAHSYVLHAYIADAHGNRWAVPVGYHALDSAVTVSANGQLTGVSFGRAAVLVTATDPSIADTAMVSVVPQGTIAAVAAGSGVFPASAIVTMHADGSGAGVIPQSAGDNHYLQWVPGGAGILLFRPMYGGHLYTITTSGVLSRLVQSASFAEDNWGRMAADGSWVFFRGDYFEGGPGYLWRIRADGTGLDSLSVGLSTQPAPSPDGTRVAYVDSIGGLHILDLDSGKDTSLGIDGWAPHWSPDGSWIAFDEDTYGILSVVRPDGTERRVFAEAGSFDWEFDWSADSRWLVGFNLERGGVCLVQVQTGLTILLPFTNGLISPTWKP